MLLRFCGFAAMSSYKLRLFVVLAFFAAHAYGQTCTAVSTMSGAVAVTHPSCRKLPGLGPGYLCDPGVPLHLTTSWTKQDPTLPACNPITWSFSDGTPDVTTTEPVTDHTYGPGQRNVGAATPINSPFGIGFSYAQILSYWGMYDVDLQNYAQYNALENAGSIPVIVSRSDARFRSTIDYAVTEVGGPHRVTTGTGTLVFEAGESSKTVSVALVDDSVYTSGATYARVTVSHPTGDYGIAYTLVSFTVNDDDPATLHRCENDHYTALEANGVATIGVVRSGNLNVETIARVRVALGYLPKREQYVVFAPGETRKDVAVNIQDNYYSGTFRADVECSGQVKTGPEIPPATWTGPTSTSSVDITDDDPVPTITIPNFQVTESDAMQTIQVPISISPALGKYDTVHLEYRYGTAAGDFDLPEGYVSFQPTVTSATIPVRIYGDDVAEGDETFQLIATYGSSSVTANVTIHDDDGTPTTFAFAQPSFTVSEPAPDATITMQRAGDVASAADVYLRVRPNEDLPWKNVELPVHFNAGATTATVAVPADDNWYTGDRTAKLELYFNSNLVATSSLKIIENEPRPVLSISEDVAVAENAPSISRNVRFIANLSTPLGVPLKVTVTPEDVTATYGGDYTGAKGAFTIEPGYTGLEIVYGIVDDKEVESDETFRVRISTQSAMVTVARDVATCTIRNDDTTPVPPSYELVLTSPTRFFEFAGPPSVKVVRSDNVSEASTVDVRQIDWPGQVRPPEVGPFHLSFAPNEREKPVVFNFVDNLYSDDRYYSFQLESGAKVFDSISLIVLDDESKPTVTLSDATATEGAGAHADFTLTLNPASAYPLTITPSATSKSAMAGADFDANLAPITIPAGSKTATLSVPIVDDHQQEPTEEFTLAVTITGPWTETWKAQATGKILDGESPQPTLTPSRLATLRGASVELIADLGAVATAPQTIRLRVTDPTILSVHDQVTIPAGQRQATIVVDALRHGTAQLRATFPGAIDLTSLVDVAEMLTAKAAPSSVQVTAGSHASIQVTLDPTPADTVRLSVQSTDNTLVHAPATLSIGSDGIGRFDIDGLQPGRTSVVIDVPADYGGGHVVVPVEVLPASTRRRSARH
jgi:hypothetical protein